MSPHPDLSRSGAEKYNRFEIAFVTCDPDMISEALRATPAPRVQYINREEKNRYAFTIMLDLQFRLRLPAILSHFQRWIYAWMYASSRLFLRVFHVRFLVLDAKFEKFMKFYTKAMFRDSLHDL